MIPMKEAVEEFDANNKRMKERLEKEDKTKRVNSETEMTDSFRVCGFLLNIVDSKFIFTKNDITV
uniref:Uncharacterized protein n=1 Tax=Rhizophagus irregularis (strain DAOM 181602 / DAOM 197198 / MUCL 43194) TaxID=747089 RepID=U9UIV3_RHIID